MRQSGPHPITAHSKRLQQLAAAFDAYRRGRPGRRLPQGLRTQVVAAIDAGASKSAVGRTCKLSWAQISGWQQDAVRSARIASAASQAVAASPRVLSVVDAVTRDDTMLAGDIELRIGHWRVSLRRAVD
jgi:hypothetical protein